MEVGEAARQESWRVVLDETGPTALLVWPQGAEGGHEPRTYEQLLDAVDQVGGEIDWDKPFPARSPAAEAIRTL
ncbi:hypothetical protein ABZV78_28190 [Micromonospora sp. NPDC004540]|uniref:hypothetical protein n=1 Tax=Micromonospora sp. NPDC004540 TaxID=3154457 RepID=UPI0033BAA892